MCIHVEVVVFFTGGTAYALLFDMASEPDLARDHLTAGRRRKDCVSVVQKPSISDEQVVKESGWKISPQGFTIGRK